jgi:hypothetical protein
MRIIQKSLLIFAIVLFVAVVANIAYADSATSGTGGLVPCKDNCTLCHLVIGVKNIFDYFLKTVLLPLFTLTIVISGIFYMISTGNKGLIDKAKTALTYSLTGAVIALTAWLLVNAILHAVGYKSVGSWSSFTCDTTQTSGNNNNNNNKGNCGGGKGNCKTSCGEKEKSGGQDSCKSGETCCIPEQGTPNGDCGGLKTKGGDSSICKKLSPELSSLLQCINNQLGSGSGAWLSLNSIIRGRGCHGGGNCSGVGNAADIFGDPVAAANAAKACGTADTILINGKAYYGPGNNNVGNQSDHYDHAHVSVNNKNCGCDWAK